MEPKKILMLLVWLAVLGGIVLVASKVVGSTASKASSAL